jgi:hypothetical protein
MWHSPPRRCCEIARWVSPHAQAVPQDLTARLWSLLFALRGDASESAQPGAVRATQSKDMAWSGECMSS